MLSYYQILQVSEDATVDEIKRAYRKLCKILHPDLHNNTKESNVIFNLLHDAYDTLSNIEKRRNYNPNSQKVKNLDVSIEDYNLLLNSHKKIVSEYKKIIKLKNSREQQLINEIKQLKDQSKFEKRSFTITENEEFKSSKKFNSNNRKWEYDNLNTTTSDDNMNSETITNIGKIKFQRNTQLLYYLMITGLIIAFLTFIFCLWVFPVVTIFILILGYFVKFIFNIFKPL